MAPGLYLVATPIGNARDLSLRALDVLGAADVIACEDTRTTAKLLAIHGLKRPMTPYHEHNAEKARPGLIRRLKKGDSVALVSDAGMPLVSDPGYKLVRACRADGIAITAVPGPSAVPTALALSGLPTDRFLFAGFLPPKSAARKTALRDLAAVRASLVVMESPRRLPALLEDMAAVLGGAREAAMTRELTKMFEEVRTGTLTELAAHYAEAGPPKGEITLVVGPPAEGSDEVDAAELDRLIRTALDGGSLRDAADTVAAATGVARRRVYNRALELAKEGGR